ncbi:MAG: WD40 repeat domain-containing protein [Acidobacteriota bacterium]
MWDSDQQLNPFPGLRAFEPDEDHLFFGREEQIDDLLSRLRRTRFLSVVGTSGSGKSSLIRSGLIPSLYSGFMARAGSSWRVAVMRPGSDPIGNLAAALNQPEVLGGDVELADMNLALLETTLYRSALGLVEAVRQARLAAGENLLVLADQFEELFRFKRNTRIKDSKDSALAFVKLLLEAAQQDDVPIYVVLTMRSDFIGNCTEFPGLAEAINRGQYLVPRMTREERKAAIVGPVAVGGAEISPRLVLRLLNDVGDDPDQLPILQHALMRTWDYWQHQHRDGEVIDLRHYEATGTMREALSLHAEEAYRELESAAEQRIAELMFRGLTDTGSDARGVRRPIALAEIGRLTGSEQAAVVKVIERFRAPGRSFLMPPVGVELDGDSVIDISHESLMRAWSRLSEWVNAEARSAQIYLQLSKAAALHQEGEAGLFRDPELQIALNWQDKNAPTEAWAQRYDAAFERAMRFLELSEQEREQQINAKERQRQRQLQRARRMVLAVAAVAVLILLFGMYSLQLKTRADEAATKAVLAQAEAERQRDEAQRQKLEADKQRHLADNERVEAEHQRERAEEETRRAEAERLRAEEEERNALAQKNRAEQAAREAARAETEAEEQRTKAVAEKERAEELRRQSEASEAESKRLEKLAIARALALQTPRLRQEDQQEVAALLARQAFDLHVEALPGGHDVDDAAIFQALLTSSRRLSSPALGGDREHRDAVRALAVAPDGSAVYSGGDDGSVRRFEHRRRGAVSQSLIELGQEVRAVAVDDAGKLLAVGGLRGALGLWRLPEASMLSYLVASGPAIRALTFSPDGALLAVGNAEGAAAVWDVEAGEERSSLAIGDGAELHDLQFSPQGDRLAAAAGSRGVLVWKLSDPNAPPRVFGAERDLLSVAWAEGGESLLAGSRDGPIVQWSLSSGRGANRELVGHESAVTTISSGGELLASGSLDGAVMLWDLAVIGGDIEPIVLADNDSWVWAVALTPDGNQVLSGGADRNIRFWPTRSEHMADGICDLVNRNLTRAEWTTYLPQIPHRLICPEVR